MCPWQQVFKNDCTVHCCLHSCQSLFKANFPVTGIFKKCKRDSGNVHGYIVYNACVAEAFRKVNILARKSHHLYETLPQAWTNLFLISHKIVSCNKLNGNILLERVVHKIAMTPLLSWHDTSCIWKKFMHASDNCHEVSFTKLCPFKCKDDSLRYLCYESLTLRRLQNLSWIWETLNEFDIKLSQ